MNDAEYIENWCRGLLEEADDISSELDKVELEIKVLSRVLEILTKGEDDEKE